MTGPLISCIIPVWNGAAFLGQAVASARAQSHAPLEIVVVDDGSTDATPDVARSMADAIRYVRQDNAGPAAARNRGIQESRGAWLAFLDADDLWHPDRLSRQLAPFAARPDLAFTACLIQNFWDPGQEPAGWAGHPRSAPLPGYTTGGLLIPRPVFERIGPFATGLGHGDSTEWILRARAAGLPDLLLDEVLVRRRLHGSNRSAVQAEQSRDEFLGILKRSLDQRRSRDRPGGDRRTEPGS